MDSLVSFCDPPYADTAERQWDNIYATDSNDVAHDVREWAIANGDNTEMRIALCGYEGEHEMPDLLGNVLRWKGRGGYGDHKAMGQVERTQIGSVFGFPHIAQGAYAKYY